MTRKEFLKGLGLSGSALWAVYCTGLLGGCVNDHIDPNTTRTVDFTLDLNDPSNAALQTNGGYVVSNGIVVARTVSGAFAAVTQVCSHEGFPNVTYQASTDQFYCTQHGARYDTTGRGLNSEGRFGIKAYQTALNGNQLRIFQS